MATKKSNETSFCKEYVIHQERSTIVETWFSSLMSILQNKIPDCSQSLDYEISVFCSNTLYFSLPGQRYSSEENILAKSYKQSQIIYLQQGLNSWGFKQVTILAFPADLIIFHRFHCVSVM